MKLYNDTNIVGIEKKSYLQRLFRAIRTNKGLYIMILPVLAYYIIFCYKPMYGAIIAFKDFNPADGILHSPWTKMFGLQHFYDFFTGPYFGRTLRNTLTISITGIIFGFPAPIILALLINELRNKYFTRVVQTISYMPHFISLVVVCGIIKDFTSDSGVITYLLSLTGFEKVTMLGRMDLFLPIYVISDIWQGVGWASIIYLAALTGINQELYEASRIDGAGRWKQTLYVTLPCLVPTIMILLILRMGSIMNIGYEKIILLYNPAIYETSDVISSFVYRMGIQNFDYSFSTAVGLFNSVINYLFLILSNGLSKKVNETSLW